MDENVHIAHKLIVRDALERVFNPGEAWSAGHGVIAVAGVGGKRGTGSQIDVLGLQILVDIDVLIGVVPMFKVVARHALGLAAMDALQLAKAWWTWRTHVRGNRRDGTYTMARGPVDSMVSGFSAMVLDFHAECLSNTVGWAFREIAMNLARFGMADVGREHSQGRISS